MPSALSKRRRAGPKTKQPEQGNRHSCFAAGGSHPPDAQTLSTKKAEELSALPRCWEPYRNCELARRSGTLSLAARLIYRVAFLFSLAWLSAAEGASLAPATCHTHRLEAVRMTEFVPVSCPAGPLGYRGWAGVAVPCMKVCISSNVRRPSLFVSMALKAGRTCLVRSNPELGHEQNRFIWGFDLLELGGRAAIRSKCAKWRSNT